MLVSCDGKNAQAKLGGTCTKKTLFYEHLQFKRIHKYVLMNKRYRYITIIFAETAGIRCASEIRTVRHRNGKEKSARVIQ